MDSSEVLDLPVKVIGRLGTHKDNDGIIIFLFQTDDGQQQLCVHSEDPDDTDHFPTNGFADVTWDRNWEFGTRREDGSIVGAVNPNDITFQNLELPVIRIELVAIYTEIKVFAYETSDGNVQLLIYEME